MRIWYSAWNSNYLHDVIFEGYRPIMHLPWLRPVWRHLLNDLQADRLSHAHCICWQPELGSDRLLQQTIRLLLCLQPTTKACGSCKSCLLAAAGNHPDFYTLDSVDDKVVGVEAVRELVNKLHNTANQHGAKVAWINHADRLSVAAANALLKTLEEPTVNTYFILSPRRTGLLLPTLRSRMQLHQITPPTVAEAEQWLASQLGRVLTGNEVALIQRFPEAPVSVYNWINDKKLPRDFIAELTAAWFGDASWPQPAKGDWPEWLAASELILQDLIRLRQRLPQTRLRNGLISEQAQHWLEQHNVNGDQLNQWLQSCYAMRRMLGEQSGLNGPLLIDELWSRWH